MSKRIDQKKLLVVLGPTASGKSDLAVRLAKRFNGEVISADSRQVYRGMDIGTGKVVRDQISKSEFLISKPRRRTSSLRGRQILNSKFKIPKQPYFYKRIEHYLIDVASPKRRFTVVQYQKLALKTIDKVFNKGKVPILCGGTGFYIQAVVDGIIIPEVPPDWQLRKNLEKKSVKELYRILKKLDPKRAKTIEAKNKRRLIRAIEICEQLGRVPPLKKSPQYECLLIGIKKPKEELKKLIQKRLLRWLKEGLIAEVKGLRKGGLSWKRFDEFGLEYKWTARFLQKKASKKEMIERTQKDLEKFAKRQMTWFKKDTRINWIKNYKEAERLVREFLKG